MEYEAMLSDIGLNRWESRTYIALLRLGSTTTGPLVKKCGVPQSKIYSVLESLNKKGLVSYVIKGKIKHFQASDPEIILSILKDKERKIEESLPALKLLASSSENKQNVEVYEGIKSIVNLFINLIETAPRGTDWYGFNIGEEVKKEKIKLFWNRIGTLRYKRGLNVKIMANIKDKELYETTFTERMKDIKKIIRYSKQLFPASTVLFRDKIIILNLLSENETAIVITSLDLIQCYKDFFIHEWDNAKGYEDMC